MSLSREEALFALALEKSAMIPDEIADALLF